MYKRPTLMFTWNDEMDVGIPEIDEDHKPIIISINEFNRSITEGKDPSEIKRRLQLVIDETIRHFSQEEELFKKWQYSEAASHARLHADILKAIQEIMNRFIPYGSDSSWTRVGITMKQILAEHFKNEDVKYAEFRQSRTE